MLAEPSKGAAGGKRRTRRTSAWFGIVFTVLVAGFFGYLGFLAFLIKEPVEREKYKQKVRVLMAYVGWLGPNPAGTAAGGTASQAYPPGSNTVAAVVTPESPAPGPNGPATWRVHNPDLELVWITALSIYVGRYEVTNEQYLQGRKDHWSGLFGGRKLDGDTQPVVRVSHPEAVAFAQWLTARERTAGRVPEAWAFRLPTVQEWQEFARCGDRRKYPWGDDWPPRHGNLADRSLAVVRRTARFIDGYADGYAVSCLVENTATNDWGLQGVAGNVQEWSQGPAGAEGVACGAAWDSYLPSAAECGMSITCDPATRGGSLGFRLVLAPEVR